MLNRIFVSIVLVAVMLGAYAGRMQAVSNALIESAARAVQLSLGLVGAMAFFLGLMRVAEDGGMLRIVSRIVAPVMRRLFPDVPSDHPAIHAMILNISSNMLGLTNAATPFGIKAMEELDRLNGRKGTATNSMVLFLAINTAGLAILPTGVISLRASLGSQDAGGIFLTTWFASGVATVVGISMAMLLSRLPGMRATCPPVLAAESSEATEALVADDRPELTSSRWKSGVAVVVALLFLALAARQIWRNAGTQPVLDQVREIMSYWPLPALVLFLVLFGWARGVRVYESLVEGAKEGFQVALRIIPYLVAILVAVGMLRASGGVELLARFLDPVTTWIGMPAEVLPMAMLRPLSGSGAYGVMAEIMTTHGPDSFIGYMVSTIQGSTDTTFYVLAVYLGAVGVKNTRHALPACLAADTAGILAAVFIVNLIFG